jgi:hypothetical protein
MEGTGMQQWNEVLMCKAISMSEEGKTAATSSEDVAGDRS